VENYKSHHTTKGRNVKLSELINTYLGRGKSTFTKQEALEDSGLSQSAFYKASSRLQRNGRLLQPRRGFFVVVRPEEKQRGGPPPHDYIDQLMEYLGRPYYAGILSAASIHGAAHHRPMEFQVVTDSSIRDIEKGSTPVKFIENNKIDVVPIYEEKVRTGYIDVATPEATAVDVVYFRKHAAGIDNIANVLIELGRGDNLDPGKLLQAAKDMHDLATIQRLGYLLDKFGFFGLSDPLGKWIQNQELSRIPLVPGGDRSGVPRDQKWEILVNTEVEPDVPLPSQGD